MLPRLAWAYARLLDEGAPADGETLRRALRALGRRRLKRGRPTGTAVASAVVLVTFFGLPFAVQPSLLVFSRGLACAVLLLLALIDARCGLLPDALTLPLLWAGLVLAWAGVGPPLESAVAGAAGGYLSLWFLNAVFTALRGRPGMGGGDMKLVGALGAWLGWASLPMLLLAAALTGLLFAFIAWGRGAYSRPFAFGPFLALAGAVGLTAMPVVQFLF